MWLSGKDAIIQAVKQINPDIVAIYPCAFGRAFIQEFSNHTVNNRVVKLIAGKNIYNIINRCTRAAISRKRVIGIGSVDALFCMRRELRKVSFSSLPMVMVVIEEVLEKDKSRCLINSAESNPGGWIQIYAANGQEAYDFLIQSVRITEEAHLPVMHIMDGVVADRVSAVKIIEDDEQVREFVNKSKVKTGK